MHLKASIVNFWAVAAAAEAAPALVHLVPRASDVALHCSAAARRVAPLIPFYSVIKASL